MAKKLTTDDLIAHARTRTSVGLVTRVKKRPFTVEIISDGIAFTPHGKKPRPNGRVVLDKYVEIYDRHRDFETRPYKAANLHDSSYFLTLIAEMLDSGSLEARDNYSEAILAKVSGDLEREFTAVLLRATRRTRDRERNIEMVATYYGFRSEPSSSKVEAGRRFGLRNRQRSEQVLNEFFLNHVNPSDLPSLDAIAVELESIELLRSDEFFAKLRAKGLIGKGPSDRGLLDLLHDVRARCFNYILMGEGVVEATRETYPDGAQCYFVRKYLVDSLRESWVTLRTKPTKSIIAHFETAIEGLGELPATHQQYLREQILASPDVITIERKDGLWYMFEDRSNSLIYQLEKIHSVTDQCSVAELVSCLRRAIDTELVADLIEGWIRQTPLLSVWNDQAAITAECGRQGLTEPEAEVRDFLLDPKNFNCGYRTLLESMLVRNRPKPTADRIITRSAFVHVDETSGTREFVYRLIGRASADSRPDNEAIRYFEFRERLKHVGKDGTERTIVAKQRKEQTLLQEWIFADRKDHSCALCQRQFERSALRAAHKKPRRICTPIEKLDPHIVMPLCLLGCDFLYEEGYVHVDGGIVAVAEGPDLPSGIVEYLGKIKGLRIRREWVQGLPSYFRKPRGN